MDLIPYDFVSAAMMMSNVLPCLSPSQLKKPGTLPKNRFCNDCGVRDLPGRHRYQLGERWDDEYRTWYVRCVRCEGIKVAMREKWEMGCFGCYFDDAADEARGDEEELGAWGGEKA